MFSRQIIKLEISSGRESDENQIQTSTRKKVLKRMSKKANGMEAAQKVTKTESESNSKSSKEENRTELESANVLIFFIFSFSFSNY